MIQPNNLSSIKFSELYTQQKSLDHQSRISPQDALLEQSEQGTLSQQTTLDNHAQNSLLHQHAPAQQSTQDLVQKWDKKVDIFDDFARHERYIRGFLSRVDFSGCASLLDFACGAGLLAQSASKLCSLDIVLADFAPAMLERAKHNNKGARAYQASWGDTLPVCDLVFASRCMMRSDLVDAVSYLLSLARFRLYFTIKKSGMFVTEQIANALQRDIHPSPGYMHAALVLYEMGLDFEMYDVAAQNTPHQSFDEFLGVVVERYGQLSSIEQKRLKDLYDSGHKHSADYTWTMFCVHKR